MSSLYQRIHSAPTRWDSDAAYSVRTINAFLCGIYNAGFEVHAKKVKGVGTVEYLQMSAAFDIETTSTMIGGKKTAFMYVWQLCINGYVIMGRSWDEFKYTMLRVKSFFGLCDTRKMFIYVHNFSYEFQFMRKWFLWKDVFALKSLTPLSAELDGYGIIFRCSYLLTGCSLAMLAGKLDDPDITKRVCDLDYNIIHTPDTLLADAEKGYCIMDVVIICLYIARCIDDEQGVENIPRTKTGYVRRRCRDGVLYHKEIEDKKQRDREMFSYRKLMSMLTLSAPEYQLCKRAFSGGFTHANCFHVSDVCENVASFDFSSSYPAVMVMDYFPMSRGRLEVVTPAEYVERCKYYCVIADVTFHNLAPRIDYEFYLSKSKCWDFALKDVNGRKMIDAMIDNGRIVSAARLTTSITEIDFSIISKVYTWDAMEIGTCYTYTRGRLPSDFVRICADLYQAKNTLKGVEGREKEYLLKKEDLNSMYGMMVTDIIRDCYTYGEDEWNEPFTPDLDEKIEEYDKSFSRFTFYPWGIYVTAHARRRLWSGILECGRDDYIYSDTDSIKIMNMEKHLDYIKRYNDSVTADLQKACAYHDIPVSAVTPKTIKGEQKVLGFWDYEGTYRRFQNPRRKTVSTGNGRRENQNDGRRSEPETGRGLPRETIRGAGRVLRIRYKLDDSSRVYRQIDTHIY